MLIEMVAGLALAFVQQPAPPSDAVKAELAAELEAALAEVKKLLPLTQDGVTFRAIEVQGTEVIYTVEVEAAVDPDAFARNLPAVACEDKTAVDAFSRGGKYTYRVMQPDGKETIASVSSCS